MMKINRLLMFFLGVISTSQYLAEYSHLHNSKDRKQMSQQVVMEPWNNKVSNGMSVNPICATNKELHQIS